MAFPTTGILDTANRADEGPPPSANWTQVWFNGISGITVFSNQFKPTGAGADAYWSAATFGPDTEVYITYATVSARLVLGGRLTTIGDGTTSGYYLDYGGATAGRLFRLDSGASTQLGATFGVNATSGDKYGLEIVGSALTAYKDGGGGFASVDSRTDTTYATAGAIGMAFSASGGRGDDFGGGTYVAPPTPNAYAFPVGGRGAC